MAGADPDSPFVPVIPVRKGPGSRPPEAKSRASHLPGGQALAHVVDWVRLYVGHELAWEMQLVIKQMSIPETRLGQFGKLGWSTWVISHTPAQDSDDYLKKDPLAPCVCPSPGDSVR